MLKDIGYAKRYMHDIPKAQLVEAAKSHLSGHCGNKSFFPSWTQSWRYLSLQLPKLLPSAATTRDVYIGIIDTKLLEKQNVVVLHSSFFSHLDGAVPTFEEEYLAYGITSGPGYKSVSLTRHHQVKCSAEDLRGPMAALRRP
jgi:hypothetical protein